MIKKFHQFITEELNKETYLSAAKLAKEKGQKSRMSNFYKQVYKSYEDFTFKGVPDKMHFSDIHLNEKSWINKNGEYYIGADLIFVSTNGGQERIEISAIKNTTATGEHIDCFNINKYLRNNDESIFRDRKSVSNFFKILKTLYIDCIRDYIHDEDGDVEIVENIREKIQNIKPYNLWSEE